MTDKAREALAELVELKDLKDRIEKLEEAERQSSPMRSYELSVLWAEYNRRKPLAWAAARAALAEQADQRDQAGAVSRGSAALLTALRELFDVANDIHGSLDEQTYEDKRRADFDLLDDHEFDITITAKRERALSKAICAVESALAETQPSDEKALRPNDPGNQGDRGGQLREPAPLNFRQGICVGLQVMTGFDNPVMWAELVRTAGVDEMLNHAAHVEPAEWELAGFAKYARVELKRNKPRVPIEGTQGSSHTPDSNSSQ